MKTTSSRILFIVTLLLSCNSPYEFWDISKFRIERGPLHDGEEVKLIYSSRAPDNNAGKEYYVQMIVVSQSSGDTINILSPVNNSLGKEDGDKIFVFNSDTSDAFRILSMNTEDLKDIKSIKDLKKTEARNITKVARDPAYDNIADNTFRTVIGIIGESSGKK